MQRARLGWHSGRVLVHLLRGIRDALGERGEAQQDHVSLVGLGLLKHSVSPVEVVQHPQDPIALVELEMVVVMEFR